MSHFTGNTQATSQENTTSKEMALILQPLLNLCVYGKINIFQCWNIKLLYRELNTWSMAWFNDKENNFPGVYNFKKSSLCFICCDIQCSHNHHSKIENLRNCHYLVVTLVLWANIR